MNFTADKNWMNWNLLDKNSQMTMIWYNYKINNLQIIPYTSTNVLRNCWCSQKVFLKILQSSLENTCTVRNVNLKFWFIHAACTFIIKETPAHSCFSVNSAEFLRIPFFEHSWVSASDFIFGIFKSNKYMKVSFLLTVFYRKSKIKQKSRVALKLGNLRFALQWSSSFVELLLSSC